MNIKSFCTEKETINNMKRQPSEWEKIFANKAIDQGLNLQAAYAAQLKNKK